MAVQAGELFGIFLVAALFKLLELDAIGGAIIGGVSASGGVGSVFGTLVGVFVICLLKTGLPFIGQQANAQQIITGIILIASVMIEIIKRKREKN